MSGHFNLSVHFKATDYVTCHPIYSGKETNGQAASRLSVHIWRAKLVVTRQCLGQTPTNSTAGPIAEPLAGTSQAWRIRAFNTQVLLRPHAPQSPMHDGDPTEIRRVGSGKGVRTA